MNIYESQAFDLIESSRIHLSTQKPSEWAEAHRVLSSDVSAFPGPLRYDRSPYLREIVDCLAPDHPAHTIAVKKGAQIGFSLGVVESGIGYIISQNPGTILFLTGNTELTEEAMNTRIDQMIDSSGLRHLIRPNVIRKRNQRTGDTSKSKEFPGGSLVAGSASNHRLLRQRSIRYLFFDDIDSAKKSSEESGDTVSLVRQRLAAYFHKMKAFYISTPETLINSNIEPMFLQGDQRYWMLPCPQCSAFIRLQWSIDVEGTKEKAGITWKLDPLGRPVDVGYICQECGGFFDDSLMYEMNLSGYWEPTAEPFRVGHYSYHISSLYAPSGMYDWKHYVGDWILAHPPGQKPKQELLKTFTNVVLGENYSQEGASPEAKVIQKNICDYAIGAVPESVSMRHGNGHIIMLTCACDLNGTEDDARLDYEIVAWSEIGPNSYSVIHGSIGTFIPGEKKLKEDKRTDRAHWTYRHNAPRSVWPEFEKIISGHFKTDDWKEDNYGKHIGGRRMGILVVGVDTGHYTDHAYAFINNTNHPFAYGLKGNKAEEYRNFNADLPVFKLAKERTDLYLLDVNYIKDRVFYRMELNWNSESGDDQPPGYMNYPTPSGGKYLYQNYFSHFEAEHRIEEGEGVASRWEKKDSKAQNHFWDVFIYNFALKDIWAANYLRNTSVKKGNWEIFVKMFKSGG